MGPPSGSRSSWARPTGTLTCRCTPRSCTGRTLRDSPARRCFRGIEGFGASNHVHTARILRLSEDLPVVIVIVDTPERIDEFLPQLNELISEGLVIREPVEVVKYVGRT